MEKINISCKLNYWVISILSFLISINAYSQSDNCDDTAQLTVESDCSNPITFNSTNSTDYWDDATGACGATDVDDAWAYFDAISTSTTIVYTPSGNTDAILTLFSGACSSTGMSSLACANSQGNNGAETITYSTTIGVRYRIRIQRNSSNNNMSGTICVYNSAPPCNAPSGINITSITSSSAILNWAAASPAPGSGYQYVVSTSSTTPTGAGTAAAGTSANVNSLTPNTTYYVFVRSNCGSGVFSAWAGPVSFTTLNVTTPANNNPCTAQSLTVGSSCSYSTYTTSGATNSGVADPGCAFYNSGRDVWFSAVVPANGILILNSSAGGITDSGMALYSGTCGSLNLLACNDDSIGAMSSITRTGLTPGSTVFIRFWAFGNSQSGTFGICAYSPPPPGNDEPCAATIVTPNSNTTCTTTASGTVQWATNSGIDNCTGTEDDDVWFSFTATSTYHNISLSNISGSTTDLNHAVYSGACGSLTLVSGSCSDPNSSLVTGLTVGVTYYVQVYTSTATSGQTSNFNICITTPPAPPVNDEPCGAITLNTGVSCTTILGTNVSASASTISGDNVADCGSHSGNEPDVWYTAQVAANGTLRVDALLASSGMTDPVIAVYSAPDCNGPFTLIDCDDDSGNGLEAQITLFGQTPFEWLFIRVWRYNDDSGSSSGTFNICTSEVVDPCSSIVNISDCGSTTITATIAAGSGTYNDSCFDTPGHEQLYSFTPTTTGSYTITQISTAVGHVNYGYNVDCDPNNWTCIDDLTSNNVTSSAFPMTAGVTYYIMLDTENTTGGDVSFTLNCPPPPPVCGGTFYDSGGASGDYSNNEYDITTIFPTNTNETVTVTFTAFNLESCCDRLYVYNGPDSSYPLIGSYGGSTIPGPFTSTDPTGALTFVFDSDGSLTYSGWAANVTCEPVVECGTDFYDSGGASGNYANNENDTTTIFPDASNELVTVTFSSFNVASGDTLTVYDGPDATAPSLGSFTGTTIPGPFTSTHATGALTFVFNSDGSNVQAGWEAAVTCNCYLTITKTLDPVGASSCNLNYAELVATGSSVSSNRVTIFSEDFSSGSFPAGWNTVNPTSNTQWIISNTSNSGGIANEAMLDWVTGFFNDTWILSSPAITITGNTNLELDLKYALSHFSSSYPYSIYFETSTDNTNWIIQNSIVNVSASVPATNLNLDLSSLDGNNTLYIRFRFTGESFGFFYWTIDDVVVTADGTPTPLQITWSPTTGLYTNSSLTTPYTGGNTDTVYASPSGTQTYTATDQFGCIGSVTVTRDGKTWNGNTNSDWFTGSNWTPSGAPNSTDCVIIPDTTLPPYTTGFFPEIPGNRDDAVAGSLSVLSGAYLDIFAGGTLTVTNEVNIESGGIVTLQGLDGGTPTNNGSNGQPTTFNSSLTGNLVQLHSGTDNNTINGTLYINRYVFVRNQDYVYWSSPVANWNTSSIFNTPLIYAWDPTIYQNATTQYGNWYSATNTIMEAGKGYIVRGPNGNGSTNDTAAWNNATFNGVPHNGEIIQNLRRGTVPNVNADPDDPSKNDNWNLVGNPYPSSLDADKFLYENAEVGNNNNPDPKIDGVIYLWSHGIQIRAGNSPFFGSFVLNYDATDYISYNYMGSPNRGFSGVIGSGQGFFVFMEDVGTVVTPGEEYEIDLVFNNSMRTGAGNTVLGDEMFFRPANDDHATTYNNLERHRIWLDLVQPNHDVSTTLIGYANEATIGKDRMYDALMISGGNNKFYSIIQNYTGRFEIQGRGLPFDKLDTVNLGVIIDQVGQYAISIQDVDGLFSSEEEAIYIEDLELGITHNIKQSPYFFNATEVGENTTRFVLKFVDQALSVENPNLLSGIVIQAPGSEYIKVSSGNDYIDSVLVYDLLGRVLIDYKDINAQELVINEIPTSGGTYIVKATLLNGQEKIQKVVLK